MLNGPTFELYNIFSGLGCCQVSEYCFALLSAQIWLCRDRRKPEVGTMPYSYRITSRILCIAHLHRQHYTLQAFEQFGALYMHNPDDKHPTWPGGMK